MAYYEYYKKSGSAKPDTSVTGTKVTTTSTSQTFNTNIAGDYVFFRAVDVVGNKGAWSEGQQVYIDVNSPTVSAKSTASATIDEGTSTDLSTYFNIDKNGNAQITSTVFTDTSNSNKVVTNTSSLAVGTHIIKCTVTKENGKTATANKTIIVDISLPTSDTLLCSWGYYVTTKGCTEGQYTEWEDDSSFTWYYGYNINIPKGVTKIKLVPDHTHWAYDVYGGVGTPPTGDPVKSAYALTTSSTKAAKIISVTPGTKIWLCPSATNSGFSVYYSKRNQ